MEISVNDLKKGMKFSKAVYFEEYKILIGPYIALSPNTVNFLKQLKIGSVVTEGEFLDGTGPEDEEAIPIPNSALNYRTYFIR